MTITLKPIYRAMAIGIVAAALLIGTFLLGSARSGSAAATAGGGSGPAGLVLSMGVQTSASSVSIALAQANHAARRVIGALKSGGVLAADIATSGLSISPNYSGNSQIPIGYRVSEQLTATLRNLTRAGSQIQAAATAGGNATTVDGVSLNLTDTSALLAQARANAVRDAQAKATQFARALRQPLGGVISISDQSATTPYP